MVLPVAREINTIPTGVPLLQGVNPMPVDMTRGSWRCSHLTKCCQRIFAPAGPGYRNFHAADEMLAALRKSVAMGVRNSQRNKSHDGRCNAVYPASQAGPSRTG